METIVNYAGLIAGLILAIIGIVLQIRSHKQRKLYWTEENTILIKGYSATFNALKISYKDKEIENLTTSQITLWNAGNETIHRADVAIPLHVWARTEEAEILDFKVLKASKPGNRFELVQRDREAEGPLVILGFEYLDPQQGAVIQVVHTGVSIAPLVLSGEVKGVKHIEYKTKKQPLVDQIPRFMIYFYGVMMFALVAAATYSSVFLGVHPAGWTWPVLSVLWLLVLVAIYIDFRQQRHTVKIPKELSAFEKD